METIQATAEKTTAVAAATSNTILLSTLLALTRKTKPAKPKKSTGHGEKKPVSARKVIINYDDRIFDAIYKTAIRMCRNLDMLCGECGNVCRGFASEIAEKGLEWASCRYTETELRALLYGTPGEVKRQVEILALNVAEALGMIAEDDGEGGILLKT